ncbi:MAG: transglycosylase SLT domain-containing protein [Gemmatimonadaceae bacterium]
MITGLLHALLLTAALSCQQGERRESAGEVAVRLPVTPTPVPTEDPDVRRAQTELADGRAALATKIVMPVLRTPERRTPEAVLVAARAATDWRGWQVVSSLLAHEPWLATRFNGEGLELLARSALERGEAAKAREHAEAALRVPSEPGARAVRLVLLARALDRLDVTDSAAATYRRAADMLPAVREWLVLRAAGSTEQTRARERLYATVRAPAARARVAYTEAQTLERFGMDLAAASAYEKLGDTPSAYRLRLASDYDAAQRSGLRAGLLGYLQREARGENLERALAVLDGAFPRLDATSQLLATRRAADGGVPSRAAMGFARVPAAMLTDDDVIAWARALIATGKPSAAATRIAARRFAPPRAAEAQYVRGLALLRAGRISAARPVLQRIVTGHRGTRPAADALYLLADLESDAGRDTRARDLLARSCLSQPAGGFSDEACFRSGILSFALGNAARAAGAFDELAKRFPNAPDAVAGLYWSGRAWEKAGNVALARERWNRILEREPLSYYASVSAKRLGQPQWLPSPAQVPRSPLLQPALNRAAVLRHLGMDVEEKHEYEGIEAEVASMAATPLLAGAALLDRGDVIRAIRLGWKAVGSRRDSAGTGDERGYSLVYPLLRDVELTLVGRARANNLDPALVAGVIRQESSWNPRAVSRAGARGLMQVMPSVGEEIARSLRYPFWDAALLFDPNVNIELGTAHLRAALSTHSSLPRALAAYNAGASRVRRWVRRTGADDPELFIERIPYMETRDYVRIVLRNAEIYRALHGLRK